MATHNKLPQKGNPDKLDRIIYDLYPDRDGYCDRIRMQCQRKRNDIRQDILNAVKDLENADNATGKGQVPAT
jgi:hypothetical protein